MSLQALKADNLPTPAEETWKYTNLSRAIPSDLKEGEAQEVVIHKNSGQVCAQAEDILFTGQDVHLHTPRLKIVLEEGAELTLIERHNGEGTYWKNMVTEIELADNAKLNHYHLQNDTLDAVHTNMVQIKLGRDAVYDGFALNIGAKLSRHEVKAEIMGQGSTCSFNGVNLLKGAQHGDTTIVVEHQAPHCNSNQFYRSILDDEARCVFQGKVHVHRIAQKTDGYQLSNALLLSEKAEMDAKPELEIYADDVKCSHGATCGQLDEEPLFYLRSRGLNEAQARALMIEAFVAEVADKVGDEAFQAEIKDKANEWLKSVL